MLCIDLEKYNKLKWCQNTLWDKKSLINLLFPQHFKQYKDIQ